MAVNTGYSRCPDDPEIERPKNFIEMISGPETWNEYGMRIISTEPCSSCSSPGKVGSPLHVSATVQVKRDPQRAPQCIFVSCWTNIKTKDNPCAIWKETFLPFEPKKSSSVDGNGDVMDFVYENSITPLSKDTWRVTFLLKWNHLLVWHNAFQEDGFVDVNGRASMASIPKDSPIASLPPSKTSISHSIQEKETIDKSSPKASLEKISAKSSTPASKTSQEKESIDKGGSGASLDKASSKASIPPAETTSPKKGSSNASIPPAETSSTQKSSSKESLDKGSTKTDGNQEVVEERY